MQKTNAINVDKNVKYSQQTQAIKENYVIFGMLYNKIDNND